MKKLIIILVVVQFVSISAYTQVGINSDGSSPNINSILHVEGDTIHNNIILNPDSTGSVGIGTTTPNEKLEVVGNIETSGSQGKLVLPSSHYDTKIELFKGGEERIGTADHQMKLIAGGGSAANIGFFGDVNEVMRVETGNGRVGILTDSPSDHLSIGEKVLISADNDATAPPVGSCVIFFDGEYLLAKNSDGIVVVIADFSFKKSE